MIITVLSVLLGFALLALAADPSLLSDYQSRVPRTSTIPLPRITEDGPGFEDSVKPWTWSRRDQVEIIKFFGSACQGDTSKDRLETVEQTARQSQDQGTGYDILTYGQEILELEVEYDRSHPFSDNFVILARADRAWKTRAAVLDYLFRIMLRFSGGMKSDTFSTAVHLYDRYLEALPGAPKEVQEKCGLPANVLAGFLFFMSAKLNSELELYDLMQFMGEISLEMDRYASGPIGDCIDSFGNEMYCKWEQSYLKVIKYNLPMRTPYSIVFYLNSKLDHGHAASDRASSTVLDLADFFMSNAFMEPGLIGTPMSLIAISSLFLAYRHVSGEKAVELFQSTGQYHRYSWSSVRACARKIIEWFKRTGKPEQCSTVIESFKQPVFSVSKFALILEYIHSVEI